MCEAIRKIPNVLTIAGSDSGGGAGIQADLKTIGALGAYGLSVLTVITAQNTREVRGVYSLGHFVRAQLDAVFDDIQIDSVKIGALGDEQIVGEVADVLEKRKPRYIVLDPVIVAKSGDRLISENGIKAIIERLGSLVTLVTPNLPEAAELLKEELAKNEEEMVEQGRKLRNKLGIKAVLMKGGHLEGDDCPDWLIMDKKEVRFEGKRITKFPSGQTFENVHGAGCTLSSAIAACLPINRGDLEKSVREAKSYLTTAILEAEHLNVGFSRVTPCNHLYKYTF